MKRSEIIATFRDRVDDAVAPYLWTDQEAWQYLDDAHREAAIRARLIRDSSSALRSLAFDIGATSVGLSPLVLDVLRARIDGTTSPLTIISVDHMDEDNPHWESALGGTPTCLVTETQGAALAARLWPSPVAAGTLLLTVIRLPLSKLNTDDDEPEIPSQYHERLIDWMMRQAYLKKDSETLDKKASEDAEARFIRSFGVFEDANVYRKRADRQSARVQFQEF